MTISWVFPSHFLTPTYINPRHPDAKTQKQVFVFSEGYILVIQYESFEL